MNFTSLMVDRYGAFFVPGRMLMDGRRQPKPFEILVPEGILFLDFREGLRCRRITKFSRREDGFCEAQSDDPTITLPMFGIPMFERILASEDRASFSLSGDGIGRFEHFTGYHAGTMGLPVMFRQTIARLDVELEFSEAGLGMKLAGALLDIDPRTIGAYKDMAAQDNLSGFEIEALFPMELLIVRRWLPFCRQRLRKSSSRTA